MNWCQIILLVFPLAASFANADDSQSCGKAQINNVIKKIEALIGGEWETNGDTQDQVMQNIGLKLKEFLSSVENTVGQCTPEENLEFEHALQFLSKMVAGETDPAEKLLPLVEDHQVLDDFTKMICEFNCIYVAEFASQLKQPTSKIRIYQTLTNLLHDTKLENKTIETPPDLPLIKVLHTISQQETDASVADALKTLLRQAFKTELNMEFGSVEELHAMDPDLTSKLIQELIHEGLIAQENCDNTGRGILHVYQIISPHDNITLWLHNLELIYNELKKTNKLNTANSVILLGYYKEMQKAKKFEAFISRWNEIAKQLPEKADKIASGEWCSKVDNEHHNIKAYVDFSQEGTDAKKLVPSDHNTKSAFTSTMSGTEFSILVDYLPSSDYKFEHPVEVEHGNLVPLPKEENSQASSYGCIPFGRIFLMGKDEPENCKMKNIIDSLLNAA